LFGEFLLFSNSNSIKGRLKNSNTAPGNGQYQYVVGYLAISGVHIYYLIKNELVIELRTPLSSEPSSKLNSTEATINEM